MVMFLSIQNTPSQTPINSNFPRHQKKRHSLDKNLSKTHFFIFFQKNKNLL